MVNLKPNNISTVVGVVLLIRHGDTSEYYQNPYTYQSNQSWLTPLGQVQQYELGSFIRSTYLHIESDTYIQGLDPNVVDIDQVIVSAEGGGGNTGLDSAYAFLQGLYPPANATYTLANGTVIFPPLQGYQYIPVSSVDQTSNVFYSSWMECNYFQSHMARVNKTAQWTHSAQLAAPFLEAVKPYLNGRRMEASFTNIWNIYDFVNFQYTHNKTFYENFPLTLLQQARHFANDHEALMFTDGVQPTNGIGFMGIRTIWPEILEALTNMTMPDNVMKLSVKEFDYKPFVGLFNVTNSTLYDRTLIGFPETNAVVALELSEIGGQYSVRMKFKNGTSENGFRDVMFTGNTTTIPLNTLISSVAWSAVNTTEEWCFSCNQTITRGCNVYNFSQDPYINGNRPKTGYCHYDNTLCM